MCNTPSSPTLLPRMSTDLMWAMLLAMSRQLKVVIRLFLISSSLTLVKDANFGISFRSSQSVMFLLLSSSVFVLFFMATFFQTQLLATSQSTDYGFESSEVDFFSFSSGMDFCTMLAQGRSFFNLKNSLLTTLLSNYFSNYYLIQSISQADSHLGLLVALASRASIILAALLDGNLSQHPLATQHKSAKLTSYWSMWQQKNLLRCCCSILWSWSMDA